MLKILVVDDDKNIVAGLGSFLSDHGYEVVSFLNGLEVMNILMNDPDVRLLIIDYSMPEIDSDVILEAMSIVGITMPVILISGTIVINLKNKPDMAFIEKPVDLNVLLKRVTDMLKLNKRTNKRILSQ